MLPTMNLGKAKDSDLVPSNRISSLILFVTVAGAPFPFGSAAPEAIAFWCVFLGLGVIAASPRGLRREHLPLLGLAVIVILGYGFVLHEQLAARPWIAPMHPLWREAAEALGGIGTPEVLPHLREWMVRDDSPRVVRESCQVAIDMWEVRHLSES